MAKRSRLRGALLTPAVALAVAAAGVAVAAGSATAHRSLIPAAAFRLTADLTPSQVVPVVQAPAGAHGHLEALLVRSGPNLAALRAAFAGCKLFIPPRRSGLPVRLTCGGLTARLPSGPGLHWTFAWRLTTSGLSGPVTGAQVHLAPAGHTAPVAFSLCTTCRPIMRGTVAVTQTQAAAMLRGDAYVTVSTPAHPDGEIRGQIRRLGSLLGPALGR